MSDVMRTPTTTEFRTSVQQAVRAGFLDRLADYLQRVEAEGSIEDRRKAVELTSKLADAMPEKDNAHTLPVVHISFGPQGMQASVTQPAKPLQTVEEVPRESLQPTEAMRRELGVNLDVEPLLFEGE